MSTHAEELSQRDRELGEVLFACLQTQEAGRPFDPAAVLARYPQFTTELTDFFADRSRVERLAAPLRQLVQAVSSVTGDLDTAPRGVDSPLPPDVTGFGDYELLGEIGRGGMGVVFRARQKSLGRVVALKMLGQNVFADARDLDRFRAEAELAATLDHPGIVPIYDVGTWRANEASPPVPYFTMKLLEGGTLAQAVRSQPSAFSHAEIAQLVAQVADAVHHAHQRGILHRDLKPSNILLQGEGTADARGCPQMKDKEQAISRHDPITPSASGSSICVHPRSSAVPIIPIVADFGLAKRLPREGEAGAELTQSGALVGTPSYMAPEQVSGERAAITTATDVYGLGAILYALLTGRPPHQGADQLDTLLAVRTREPESPSRVRPGVPRDLETICVKAMAREPARRYGSAAELAADLRRWLAGEPIEARPAGRAEKARRWCRRNPGMAGLAAAVVLLMLGMTATSAWAAIAAGEREAAARLREQEAVNRERTRQREMHVQKAQLIRTGPRSLRWRKDAWQEVRQASDIYRQDQNYRLWKEATAILEEIDAEQVKWFEPKRDYEYDASSVAFSPDGKWLLLGGASDDKGKPILPARLWQRDANDLQASEKRGTGPVTFRPDGSPLQLVPEIEPPSLLLWDVVKQAEVSQCRFPRDLKVARLARNRLDMAVTALSADGALIAAVGEITKAQALLGVWDAATGKLLWHERVHANTLALAFSPGKPDERVLAAADTNGSIGLWPVEKRTESFDLPPMGSAIHCLAFSNDRRCLAAGDAGGTVNVWDWKHRRPVSRCFCSRYDIYALAFSPDGTLIASCGRVETRLWDVATGRPLLEMPGAGNYITGLAFSPDGKFLAACGITTRWQPGQVLVWELEYGRGIQTLRGLSSQVTKVRFSPDGGRVAALGLDWRVAIWEVENGRRRDLFPVPPGDLADNAGLALTDDGRFAFAAGRDAKLWDLNTGNVLDSWEIPPGYHDHLVFDKPDRLLLFRMETEKADRYPKRGLRSQEHPRVFRVHELIVGKPAQVIRTVTDFNEHVQSCAVAPDGSYFFVSGLQSDAQGRLRSSLHRYETLGGANSWSLEGPGGLVDAPGIEAVDPTGKFLALSWGSERFLVEAATGKRLETFAPDTWGFGLSPGAKLLARRDSAASSPESPGLALVRRGRGNPMVVLSVSGFLAGPQFYSERYLALGNEDGSVLLCDLFAIQ